MNQPPPELSATKLPGPFNLAMNPAGFQVAVSQDESTTFLIILGAPGEAELSIDPEGKQKITIVMSQEALRGLRDILTSRLSDKRIIVPGDLQ